MSGEIVINRTRGSLRPQRLLHRGDEARQGLNDDRRRSSDVPG
jgi:hypothetical protein